MLDTLLEKLSTLLPKNFIISAFFPVLLFSFLNGLLFYLTNESFRGRVTRFFDLDAGKQALFGFPVLIAIALIAYLFSMLNLSMRRALEGESLPGVLKKRLLVLQQAKLHLLDDDLDVYRQKWLDLKIKEDEWRTQLKKARARGNTKTATCSYSKAAPAARAIEGLRRRRELHRPLSFSDIGAAVVELEKELKKCAVDDFSPGDADLDNKNFLDKDHIDLIKLIPYAVSYAENDYADQFNKREYRFSSYKLAPTSMGNIAESVRGYARSRYDINLDPFWLRLQKVIQDDGAFYASLLDAKTQLDFLVALFWLTTASTIFWLSYLIYIRQAVLLFLSIGLLGPALAFIWYKIAIQNYLAFADILRTSIDLYRFKLLDALQVNRPENRTSERQVWADLNQVVGYGSEQEITYSRKQD